MENNFNFNCMQYALKLAEKGRFTVSPNPMVGCLIVKDNVIFGEGYHQKAGLPHAEIYALKQAGDHAKGATAYITLEPCAHYGRTPPCTETLIAAGIKKVFIACLDPNPLVCGKGVDSLRSAGIEVEIGLGRKAAEDLNEIFFHYINKKQPFVIAKWAMSLDGKTITHPDDSRQISSHESQCHSHQLRLAVDAILVGANTIRCDDPQLTARFTTKDHAVTKQPIRIILSTTGAFPPEMKVFSASLPGKTILVSTEAVDKTIFSNDQFENLIIPKNESGKVNLSILLEELGKREITSLLVEGGEKVRHSFIHANLINKYHIYLSPTIIGNLPQKRLLEYAASLKIGSDFYLVANNKEASSCLVE